ncbi:hypothetical protein CDES_11760 [Corynebacterium deserti GIMN1.010]|uniref:Bacterial SCP orthologue domain-containing protein n=1 Tax=Corynebacterium deserti GIMN1.010 TaxID=931089 RepID=A0A0M5IGJ2_9CORY|nr:sterol carrier family protein [Corynebacterium deserti]ALC06706.1 hypothetical protein CDES_11760 [Corynebacterium deserti GIMN1.010]
MRIDPAETRQAVLAIEKWINGEESVEKPGRSALAAATRLSARLLAQDAPGHSVEVRVPPFVAVQCIDGPKHTRGTPPNVVETDPHTWLRLATGVTTFDAEVASGKISASGTRAGEIADWLPVVKL